MNILLIISLLVNTYFIWRIAKGYRMLKQLQSMETDGLKAWLEAMPDATQIPIQDELNEIDLKGLSWFQNEVAAGRIEPVGPEFESQHGTESDPVPSPRIVSLSFQPLITTKHEGPVTHTVNHTVFEGYEIMGSVTLLDNEYLDPKFQEIGHHGDHFVFGEIKSYYIIIHNRTHEEMFVDKRAVHKFVPMEPKETEDDGSRFGMFPKGDS